MTIEDIKGASERTSSPLVYLVPLSAVGVAFIVSGLTKPVRIIMLPELTIDGVNAFVTAHTDKTDHVGTHHS